MKSICRNCHFLAKEYPEPNTGRRLSFSLSNDERVKARKSKPDLVSDIFILKCQMGVWDEGIDRDTDDRLRRINDINRKDTCFFFPFTPSMTFNAAKELQNRRKETSRLKKSNFTGPILVGLLVAAVVVFIFTPASDWMFKSKKVAITKNEKSITKNTYETNDNSLSKQNKQQIYPETPSKKDKYFLPTNKMTEMENGKLFVTLSIPVFNSLGVFEYVDIKVDSPGLPQKGFPKQKIGSIIAYGGYELRFIDFDNGYAEIKVLEPNKVLSDGRENSRH